MTLTVDKVPKLVISNCIGTDRRKTWDFPREKIPMNEKADC